MRTRAEVAGPGAGLSLRGRIAVSPVVRLCLAALCPVFFSLPGCGRDATEDPSRAAGESAERVADVAPAVRFRDVAAELGIDFRHRTGFDGKYWFPEITTPGCAVFDADGDGLQDIFLVDGGALAPGTSEEESRPRHRLYRNRGDGKFEDVTRSAGIVGVGYGQGAAVGDYDGDGDLDLYLTNVGPNQLFLNTGSGRFRDVSSETGVDDASWASSAAFGDLDADGDLDLYVANYCLWSPASQVPCKTPSGEPDYCNPRAFEPAPDVFYRNRGDGTFEDATVASGVSAFYGRGLGVVLADFDGDGLADIYVANDGDPNSLWLGNGDGTFREEGLLSGSALNAEGNTEASMGVTVSDLENDGDWDIFITHMTGETNTLYRNEGGGFFEDWSLRSLSAPSMPLTGFGTLFFDADLDGDDDLFVVNGAVVKASDAAREAWPYAQRDQFFVGLGDAEFSELSPGEHPWLEAEAVGRGAAFGDLDADGDIDIVVANAEGPPFVLRNESSRGRQHWVGLHLEQEGQNREAIGAVVRVSASLSGGGDAHSRSRRVSRDGSYASANEARVVFGLPPEAAEVRSIIVWPDGQEETVVLPALDRDYRIVRGIGAVGPDGRALGGTAAPGLASGSRDNAGDASARAGEGDDLPGAGEASVPGGAMTPLPDLVRSESVPPLPELSKVDDSVAERVRAAYDVVVSSLDLPVAWKEYGLALYADAGDEEGARRALEQAVVRNPEDVRSLYLLAVLENSRGEVDRSRAYLERTLVLSPGYQPARIRLAEALRTEGDREAAKRLFTQVLEDSPEDSDALEGLGRLARAAGDLPEALELLERSVRSDGSSRGAHYELGLALRAAGELDRARAELEAATNAPRKDLRDPWLAELYAGRGGDNQLLTAANRARLEGKLDLAAQTYGEYTIRRPEDAVGWSNLAAAQRDLGQLGRARESIGRAVALEPESARLLALSASISQRSGDAEGAIRLLERAVALDPGLAQAWLDLGTLQVATGDRFAAVSSFQRYVELRPSDAGGFFQLGEAAIAIGELDRATQALEQSVRQDSTQGSALFRLGGLALRRQDGVDAEARFRAALRQNPGWAEAHLGLAHALKLQGNLSGAVEEAERAAALRPDSEAILRSVAAFKSAKAP